LTPVGFLAALGLAAFASTLARALADRCLVGFGGKGFFGLHGSMLGVFGPPLLWLENAVVGVDVVDNCRPART